MAYGKNLCLLSGNAQLNSTMKKELRWHFPYVLSPEAHAEWRLYKILEDMGLHEELSLGETQTKNGPHRRRRRKTKDQAPIWASSITSAEEKIMAGKTHRPTLRREYEAPCTPTSFQPDLKHLKWKTKIQGNPSGILWDGPENFLHVRHDP